MYHFHIKHMHCNIHIYIYIFPSSPQKRVRCDGALWIQKSVDDLAIISVFFLFLSIIHQYQSLQISNVTSLNINYIYVYTHTHIHSIHIYIYIKEEREGEIERSCALLSSWFSDRSRSMRPACHVPCLVGLGRMYTHKQMLYQAISIIINCTCMILHDYIQ